MKANFDAQSEHTLTFQNEEKPLSLSNANIIKGPLLYLQEQCKIYGQFWQRDFKILQY